MKNIDKSKKIIYFLCITISIILALNIFPLISVKDKSHNGFSAEKVADDIKCISKSPHSIEHPKERAAVREYLFHRLQQMGGTTQRFEYDSIKCKFGGTFDIANIYSIFNPDSLTDSTKYILFIAHLDSRFAHKVKKDTVYSFGAADDGYGLGVIIESVRCALNYRAEWKQGIKVLFTDSEEHELDGMQNMVNNNKELLENVNFIINIDARGVKGDALLFETSQKNKAIMELYKEANSPRGFSLTTLVYTLMPNFTDFTLVRDSIPGMNFAVIDNLKYYHTNLDCYSNISLKSIQHYGIQIEPILHKYLTSNVYSNYNALKSTEDSVFFSYPLFGIFIFSHYEYIILNIISFILFGIAFFMAIFNYRLSIISILKKTLVVLSISLGTLIIGEAIGYLSAILSGLEFNIVAVKYVNGDNIISALAFSALLIFITLLMKYKNRANKLYSTEMFLASLLLLFILSGLMLITVFENFFFLVTLLISSLTLMLTTYKQNKWVLIISSSLITFTSLYFINILYIAITIGSLGILLFIGTFSIIILVSQFYCFKR